MKASIAAVFAVAALVGAQSPSDYGVPACANDCFLSAVGNSTCALTDFYCQCGAQQEQIQGDTLKCLCTSTCSTTDLFQVYQASTKICEKALDAHGETYNAPAPNFAGACGASTGTSSSGASSGTAKATTSGGTEAAAVSTSASSSEQTSSAGAARALATGAVAALGGLAMFAL